MKTSSGEPPMAGSLITAEQGVQLDSDITLGPDQTWQFWIKDPDGNRIELMQYTERSLQVFYN